MPVISSIITFISKIEKQQQNYLYKNHLGCYEFFYYKMQTYQRKGVHLDQPIKQHEKKTSEPIKQEKGRQIKQDKLLSSRRSFTFSGQGGEKSQKFFLDDIYISIKQEKGQERQKTFIGLNDKIVNLEKELEQKDLQIARKDQMMKGYTDRLAKNTEQINELRKHLRETSTKYKQLSTSVKNMKFHKQSEKQREITALGKVIKFYEQQRKPNETEEQLKNILQFSQNQQADIDVLLLKLMEKEQFYRNKEEVLEKQTKLEESATVFTAANCDRIEQSLKNSVEFQSKICDRIVQIIEENDYLRKKVEQMNVLIQRSTKTQSKIKGYEQTLQGMVLKCSAWLQKEPQQRVRQLNQKTTQIMEMQSRLKSKEYQMRKDKQQMLKMQSTIKVLQAKCKQQQLQLMNHTKENQSHNFELLNVKNKLNQLKQINNHQYSFFGKQQKALLHTQSVQEQIKDDIQKYIKRQIKVLLIYQKHQGYHNFGKLLNENKFPLMFVAKINKSKYIGVFSSSYQSSSKSENQTEISSFLFTFNNRLKYFSYDNLNVANEPWNYQDGYLTFGSDGSNDSSEVALKDNTNQYKIFLNMKNKPRKHYDISEISLDFGDTLKGNKINYQKLEIYKIIF